MHHILKALRITYMTKLTYIHAIRVLFFAFIIGPGTVSAHDFWISPQTYQSDTPQNIPTSIMIGHIKDKSLWSLDPHRIVALRSMGPDGITDHQASIKIRNSKGALPISFKSNGTHVLTIETTSATSVLGAEKFESYIEDEGLTPIIRARKMSKTEDRDGREIYSRRGKALVQIGDVEADAYYVSQPLGLTLEIVPLENPYSLAPNSSMTSKIYYRGLPMKGVTVRLVSLDTGESPTISQKSDGKGTVTFNRPDTGNWMLHAVWSDPLENNPDAEFDTIFSSLSFGF